jgi:hypothetical protein
VTERVENTLYFGAPAVEKTEIDGFADIALVFTDLCNSNAQVRGSYLDMQIEPFAERVDHDLFACKVRAAARSSIWE